MAKNKPQQKTTPAAKPTAPMGGSAPKKVSTTPNKESFKIKLPESQNTEMLFDKLNYILLSIGGVFIVLGFILMSGGNQDPNVFNEAEIYSFRRITLAPISIMIGFIVVGIAILKKPSTTTVVE